MQQHRQLSCNGHDGSFLRVPFASDRQCLAESSQVAVLSERPQDVLRRLDKKAAQQAVTLFRDAQLRVGVSALASRRYEPEIGPDCPALPETARMLQRQDLCRDDLDRRQDTRQRLEYFLGNLAY